MRRWRSFALYLLAAAAFGVAVAVINGQDTGVRDALGNLSAPWVVVPFLAGTLAEPFVVLVLDRAGVWAGDLLFRYSWLWVGEVFVGLVAVAAVWPVRRLGRAAT